MIIFILGTLSVWNCSFIGWAAVSPVAGFSVTVNTNRTPRLGSAAKARIVTEVHYSERIIDLENSTESFLISPGNETLQFDLKPSIGTIPSAIWDSCPAAAPFLSHAWLRCLEESDCVSSATGWVPQHLTIHVGDALAGFMPLYVKGHSFGEFIFDQSWAKAAYQNRIDYYPKLLSGSPFTPATGNRILWLPETLTNFSETEIARFQVSVGTFLKKLAIDNSLSSVHVNFLTDSEASSIAQPLKTNKDITKPSLIESFIVAMDTASDCYIRRTGLQFHWHNQNPRNNNAPYNSFEDYLLNFKSKRRISIRRERDSVRVDQGIRVDAISGLEIRNHPELTKRMFEIYLSTIEKMSEWGRQYLTLDFFERLVASEFCESLCFLCARRSSATDDDQLDPNDVFAGTINIISGGVFYGRYWGCTSEEATKNLHFETCYWAAIEYCIENGLHKMEPGAGGGDYKWARGFDPEIIHSIHYLCHPGLRQAIREFTDLETVENLKQAHLLQRRRAAKHQATSY